MRRTRESGPPLSIQGPNVPRHGEVRSLGGLLFMTVVSADVKISLAVETPYRPPLISAANRTNRRSQIRDAVTAGKDRHFIGE